MGMDVHGAQRSPHKPNPRAPRAATTRPRRPRPAHVEPLEHRILLASELFFAATTAADGRELWSYTGAGSPVRRSQIRAGSASGDPTGLTAYNGKIYFAADNG